jgi:multimeric flavodoxin WrbA
VKILLLQSSGRTKGNTARILAIADKALRAEAKRVGEPIELETLHLAELDVRPCTGCRSCFNKGEASCPLKDDMPQVKAKMREADGLILAGPVYVNDVNGIMKNWIDRLAHVCHRPEFADKTAMLLATTGATPAKHALRSMQVPLWTWGYRIAAKAWFAAGAITPASELERRYSARVGAAVHAFFQDLRLRRFLKPSFLSLVIFRIQQRGWGKAAPGSIDYSYWHDKGWLDARRSSYFFPHRANPVKVAAARLVGSIAAVFAT